MCLCEIKEVGHFLEKSFGQEEAGSSWSKDMELKKVKTACNEFPPDF